MRVAPRVRCADEGTGEVEVLPATRRRAVDASAQDVQATNSPGGLRELQRQQCQSRDDMGGLSRCRPLYVPCRKHRPTIATKLVRGYFRASVQLLSASARSSSRPSSTNSPRRAARNMPRARRMVRPASSCPIDELAVECVRDTAGSMTSTWLRVELGPIGGVVWCWFGPAGSWFRRPWSPRGGGRWRGRRRRGCGGCRWRGSSAAGFRPAGRGPARR